VVPGDALPAYSFVVFRATPITQKFIVNIAVQLGLHFTVIADRFIIKHRTIQLDYTAGPDNAYFILQYKFLSNLTLLTGP
jgi:hypothetical protein